MSEPRPQPSAARMGRQYAFSGALWSLAAAGLGLAAQGQLALGVDAPIAALGFGRLDVAYRQALLFGALSLPLAGGLLAACGLADRPAAWRTARLALRIWNLGLGLGLLAILAGFMQADAWLAMPSLALAMIWLAALAWTLALRTCLDPAERPLGLVGAAGLLAAAGLLLCLGLGALLMASVSGAGQALAGALIARGLPALWALPAAVGLLAAMLPEAAGRPLFGRRLAYSGLWLWSATAALALPRDLLPELLPAWLSRPVEAASVLGLAPAVALGAVLSGTFLGRPAATEPASTEAGAVERRGWLWLLIGAALALTVGLLADVAVTGMARRALQFSTWSPAAALVPPPGAAWLTSVAAAWALFGQSETSGARVRWLVSSAFGALTLGALPLAPLALAEAAAGASDDLLRLEAQLRLPGLLAFAVVAAVLCESGWRLHRAPEAPGPTAWSRPVAAPLAAPAWLNASTALLVAILFVSCLLPLADPAMSTPGTRAAARQIAPGSLSADGRDIYVAEGCIVCHSQRVRDSGDAAYGLPMALGDYVGGPPLAGLRRAGPDLAWAGERFDEAGIDSGPGGDSLAASLLAERLAAHAAGGTPAYPWLFERAGPLPAGRALVAYLNGLRSRAASLPAEASP